MDEGQGVVLPAAAAHFAALCAGASCFTACSTCLLLPPNHPHPLPLTHLPICSLPLRCAEEYTDVGGYGEHVDPSIAICAGYLAGAPPLPCNGDSGGPLLYTPTLGEPATHKQVGAQDCAAC